MEIYKAQPMHAIVYALQSILNDSFLKYYTCRYQHNIFETTNILVLTFTMNAFEHNVNFLNINWN